MLCSPLAENPVRIGRYWLFADGTVLPVVAGGDGTEGEPSGEPSGGTPTAPEQKIELTQAQLDAQAAGIRKEAERAAKKAAEKNLADALGCSLDEAKQIIADRKSAEEASRTEAEKREAEAKKREDAAAERERLASAKERAADVKLALMDAGVNSARLSRATTLLMADIEADADAEAIKTAAEALKTEMPELFGAGSPNGGGNGAPSGDPSGGPKPGGKGEPTGIEAGRQRALARKQATTTDPNADPLGAFAKIG